MATDLRVSCPHCGSVYRLKSRQAVGRKMTCRDCGDEFTARLQGKDREPEPEEDLSDDDLPPPVRGRATVRKKVRQPQKSQKTIRIVAVAAVVIVVGLGLVLSGALGPLMRVITTGRTADSPDVVYADLASAMRDIRKTAESIRDADSRKRAIQKFKDMKPRFADLTVRACLLESVSEQECKDLAARHKESLTWSREDLKQVSQRINDSGQGGIDLVSVIAVVANQFHSATDALEEGLKHPVEPQNAADKFEYDCLLIKRQLVRRLAKVSAAADLDAAAADIKAAAVSLEELATERSNAEPGVATYHGRYLEYRSAVSHLMEHIKLVLQTRHGTHNGLRQALMEAQMAEDIVFNPLPKGMKRTIFTNPLPPPAAAESKPTVPKKEGFGFE